MHFFSEGQQIRSINLIDYIKINLTNILSERAKIFAKKENQDSCPSWFFLQIDQFSF